MDQTSGTTSTAPEAQDQSHGADASAASEPPPHESPGFLSRGRTRRRVRFLRKARELAYRDLGGLIFNLHRFGARNDQLVLAKLSTVSHIDGELRTLESALKEHQPVTVLREAGITACARCAAIHSSEDNFCPNCGLSMARHADLPIAGAAAPPAPAPTPTSTPIPATAAPPASAQLPTPPSSPPAPPQPTGAPPAGPVPEGESTEILRPASADRELKSG